MPINDNEAKIIAAKIAPLFSSYLNKYSFAKYPADDYARYKYSYSELKPTNAEIHNSLVWKWGHYGKTNFPSKQKNLIMNVESLWLEFVNAEARLTSKGTFVWWREKLPSTAYISAAYIAHLVHHTEPLPIIDQHNFRAMNFFIKQIHPIHTANKIPNTWKNIVDLKSFMAAVLKHLPCKGFDELDRFLMMYGQSIKPKKPKKTKALT